MITTNIKLLPNDMDLLTLYAGRQGEGNARKFVFDLSEFEEMFGEGTAIVVVQRSELEEPYIATTEQNGNEIEWIITETDTYRTKAVAEVRWLVDGIVAKSVLIELKIDKAIHEIISEQLKEPLKDVINVTYEMTQYIRGRLQTIDSYFSDAVTINNNVAKIQSEIEQLVNVCERVESSINESKLNVNRIYDSILKEAINVNKSVTQVREYMEQTKYLDKTVEEILQDVSNEVSATVSTLDVKVEEAKRIVDEIKQGQHVELYFCSDDEYTVDGLPDITNPDEKKIYLVPNGEEGLDVWDEYIWRNNKWELFGSSTLDLSQFATKDEVMEKFDSSNVATNADIFAKLQNRLITANNVSYALRVALLTSSWTEAEQKQLLNDIFGLNNYVLPEKKNQDGAMKPEDIYKLSDGLYYFIKPIYNVSTDGKSIQGMCSISEHFVNNYDYGIYFGDFNIGSKKFTTVGSIDGYGATERG